jgi:hypothetical protein
MITRLLLLAILAGCGSRYTKDDASANEVAARNEARTYEMCTDPDAGLCTPGKVRIKSYTAFCANQRELAFHGAAFDGGPQCPASR